MNAVAKELARQAKKAGICEEWHSQLKQLTDKEAMIDMYIRGIDFCLSNDYPSNDFIRDNFKGIMEAKGIILDDEIALVNPRRCVALGDTSGRISVGGYSVCEVFAKHHARLCIIASGNAFVEVDAFDDSLLSVIASDEAKVHINRYGGAIEVEKNGNAIVKFVQKNQKTY